MHRRTGRRSIMAKTRNRDTKTVMKKYCYITLTLSNIIIHDQLEALSSPHHADSVPLIVIEFLPSIKSFRSLAWGG